MKSKELKATPSDSVFKDKKAKTWSQTIKNGDITKEINVEELDNGGYLVTLSRYGYENKDSKKEKYISDHRKLYSEVNPLDKDETDNPIDQFASMLTRNK
jgi:hypothetical protein